MQQQQQQQQHQSFIFIKDRSTGKRIKFVSRTDIQLLTGAHLDKYLAGADGIQDCYKISYNGITIQSRDRLGDFGVRVADTLFLDPASPSRSPSELSSVSTTSSFDLGVPSKSKSKSSSDKKQKEQRKHTSATRQRELASLIQSSTWIILKSDSGKAYRFVARDVTGLTGLEVKQHFRVATGLDEMQQVVTFRDREVFDSEELGSVGVTVGSTLCVTSKKRFTPTPLSTPLFSGDADDRVSPDGRGSPFDSVAAENSDMAAHDQQQRASKSVLQQPEATLITMTPSPSPKKKKTGALRRQQQQRQEEEEAAARRQQQQQASRSPSKPASHYRKLERARQQKRDRAALFQDFLSSREDIAITEAFTRAKLMEDAAFAKHCQNMRDSKRKKDHVRFAKQQQQQQQQQRPMTGASVATTPAPAAAAVGSSRPGTAAAGAPPQPVGLSLAPLLGQIVSSVHKQQKPQSRSSRPMTATTATTPTTATTTPPQSAPAAVAASHAGEEDAFFAASPSASVRDFQFGSASVNCCGGGGGGNMNNSNNSKNTSRPSTTLRTLRNAMDDLQSHAVLSQTWRAEEPSPLDRAASSSRRKRQQQQQEQQLQPDGRPGTAVRISVSPSRAGGSLARAGSARSADSWKRTSSMVMSEKHRTGSARSGGSGAAGAGDSKADGIKKAKSFAQQQFESFLMKKQQKKSSKDLKKMRKEQQQQEQQQQLTDEELQQQQKKHHIRIVEISTGEAERDYDEDEENIGDAVPFDDDVEDITQRRRRSTKQGVTMVHHRDGGGGGGGDDGGDQQKQQQHTGTSPRTLSTAPPMTFPAAASSSANNTINKSSSGSGSGNGSGKSNNQSEMSWYKPMRYPRPPPPSVGGWLKVPKSKDGVLLPFAKNTPRMAMLQDNNRRRIVVQRQAAADDE